MANCEQCTVEFEVQLLQRFLRTKGTEVDRDERWGVIRGARRMAARWESLVHTPLAIQRRVRQAQRDRSRPVLVGPWCSEVGFELLYWIPFLRKLFGDAGIASDRVVSVSRGGVGHWYHGVADEYRDLLDSLSHEEYLAYANTREREQGVKKQLDTVACEQAMIARLSAELDNPVVFTPSLMYRLFAAVWRGLKPTEFALDRCRPEPMPRDLTLPEGFPADGRPYAAVKLYRSDAWPDNAPNRAYVGQFLEELSARTRVVVLQTEFAMDDHNDHSLPGSVDIVDAARWLEPRTNLEVQTAIVAHATELHTTYGGFAYLGGLLGVPTTAYSSNDGFVKDHLELSDRVFVGPDFAPIVHRHVAR